MIKKNFTRKDLTNKIYQKLGFSKNISSNLIDNFFDSLSDELLKFGRVKISSFGTFTVRNKKERIGRNPKTKVESKISARRVVRFKSSLKINQKINNNAK